METQLKMHAAPSELSKEYILKVMYEEFHHTYKPRESQALILDKFADWVLKYFTKGQEFCEYLVVDAPTGVGKSLLAMTLTKAMRRISEELDHKIGQILLTTERKILQDQYATDFPDDLFNLKGLDNYDCYMDVGKSCGESKCGRVAKKEGKSFPEVCTKACGYDLAVKKSITEPVILTNSAKYINLVKYHIGRTYEDPSVVIYDEGHNVENLLDSEAALDLSSKVFERLKLKMDDYFPGVMQTTPVENLIERLENFVTRLTLILQMEEVAEPEKRDAKLMRMLESLIEKVNDVRENPDNFVLLHEVSPQGAVTFNFKSKFVHKAFRKMFPYPTVFLSATMLSAYGFQSMTGLQDTEMTWISVGTPFKKENRPVHNYWYMGAKSLNYRNMAQEFPNVLLRVESLMEKHKDERGIIHAQSYANANSLYEGLYAKYGRRLIYPKNAKEQKEALERLKQIPNGVLISPSMTEGVDLKGDLCRWVAFIKVPYLKTVDPVVSLRMRTLLNWYEYKSCMSLVQGVGRGVRNEEDYATTYLLDPEFGKFYGRAKHLLPQWFLESWITMPIGPA